MSSDTKERNLVRPKVTILPLILVACLFSPLRLNALDQNVDYEELRRGLVSTLELQYQITLDLPLTPMTEASLSSLDMAIAGVASATYEELEILRVAGFSDTALMTNLKIIDDLVRKKNHDLILKNGSDLITSTQFFECDADGYVELAGELERPPGFCNQSDTQVVNIDYLPVGSNDELFLSDNQYPETLLCDKYVEPEITALLLLNALLAENLAMIASRGCQQGVFFFASGGNASLGCIVTDLISLGFKHAAEGVQFCNAIRGASEGRTTYVRTGELFVQSGENTEFIDSELIDGFDALNGEIGEIQDRACQNAVRLNEATAQLDETLRTLRISDAWLLDLLGDQLDPINPVPIPVPDCALTAVAEALPTDSSSETIPTVEPPPSQPMQPEIDVTPQNPRARIRLNQRR